MSRGPCDTCGILTERYVIIHKDGGLCHKRHGLPGAHVGTHFTPPPPPKPSWASLPIPHLRDTRTWDGAGFSLLCQECG